MKLALVATSHGTDVPAAREAIGALVDAVRAAAPQVDVHEAFVDVQEPRVATVVRHSRQQGFDLTVIVPLLLAPGFHVHVDVQEAAAGDQVVAASTLGPDDRLTQVLLRRLAAAGATSDDIVVLGAAGSTDVRALESIDRAARLLGAAWGAPVRVGHLGGSGTPISQVVGEVAGLGRRVVVASYLMAPGYFHHRLTSCGADVVTRPLLDGPRVDPVLVELVLDKLADAVGAVGADRSAPSERIFL